ncbi:MAG: hypothetical protein RR939_06880 [Acinetobacter sp.]
MTKYTPPDSHNVIFNFEGDTYTAPDSHNVVFNFGAAADNRQYVTSIGSDSLQFGEPNIRSATVTIYPAGFDSFAYGGQNIRNNARIVSVSGLGTYSSGTTRIFNLKQIVNLTYYGLHSYVAGQTFVIGGVKYVQPTGLQAALFGPTVVKDPKGPQTLRPVAFNAFGMGSVNVSPRILRPNSFVATLIGSPIVRRNPSPLGIVATQYGQAWVSHNPRSYQPAGFDSLQSGYPKIYDPTQKIYLADKGIGGGVFGDILLRNKNKYVYTTGFNAQKLSVWASVESNLRKFEIAGFDSSNFGLSNVRNKTPSLHPTGFNSFAGLNVGVGFRIRYLLPSGFDLLRFGIAALSKPPELYANGFNSNSFGNTVISNKIRFINVLGIDSLKIGSHTTWFRYRVLSHIGVNFELYGQARVEHQQRTILAKGSDHALYGQSSWVSFGRRLIEPTSIFTNFASNHLVGGTQYIHPDGYIATKFGSRIIPESRNLYPIGFSNVFGTSEVDLKKKYISPKGFITVGTETQHRWGTPKLINSRQYIVQFYDGDSELVPPKLTGWTNIHNKNRIIGAIGSNLSKFSYPNIENKARPLIVFGFNTPTFSVPMVADRVRYVRPNGLESPYISGWSNIHNAAFVISPKGINSQSFGYSGASNTRRYFQRIGNFESLSIGLPFIADRIRKLTFEKRYTIGPPIIHLPKVELFKRYIDEVAIGDLSSFGNAMLSIHFNRITPRWILKDGYGIPIVKNLTPELLTKGRAQDEYGNASVRTQWREMRQMGNENTIFGKTDISFRTKRVVVSGFNSFRFGDKLKIIKGGAPPYSTQYIYLNVRSDSGGSTEQEKDGDGIEPPVDQVPRPIMRTNVVTTRQDFHFTVFGQPKVYANTIRVEPGYQELLVGEPVVELKNRQIIVTGIESTVKSGIPGVSPRYIRASDYFREIVPEPKVEFYHRNLKVNGSNHSDFSTPIVDLKRKYIKPKGFHSLRYGWSMLSHDIYVEQFDSVDAQEFGTALVFQPRKTQKLNVYGIPPNQQWGYFSRIENLHRELRHIGHISLQMGSAVQNDTPFMWRGLRVGPLIKGNYGGFESLKFGTTWISLKVREVKNQGFDAFVCNYDLTQFNKRMRVTTTPISKPIIYLLPVGFDGFTQGVPNIRPAAHYIRPDGNADQYRKGAF